MPAATDKQADQITIYGFESTLPDAVMQVMETARQKVQIRTLVPLSSPEGELHSAIRATAKALRKAKPFDGIVYANNPSHCGIAVGIASIERTIVILDAIARALNEQGLALEPAGTKMGITKDPDELTFTLIERVQTQKHIPTPEEVAKEEKRLAKRERDIRLGNWSFDNTKAYPEFDYIRTGELGIQIADQYVRGVRRSWKDGKTQKVEDLIDEITVGIVAYLAGVKARREEHERRDRQWKLEAQQRELARQHQEREGKRREFVLKAAQNMAEIENLEKFLLQIQAYDSGDTADEFTRMVEWVVNRITSLKMRLNKERLLSALQKNELFPENDSLIWVFEEAEE